MKFLKSIYQFIKCLIFIGLLFAALSLTPIFANLGVFALDIFSRFTLPPSNTHEPTTVVILGGGLIKQNGEITLNHYSISRADTAIITHGQHTNLPIITSGVESPWLIDYLKKSIPNATIIGDNASMNTCENAIFSEKLLKHHEIEGAVFLITDRYHMARARRQFARVGIATTPQPAPLAIAQSWHTPKNNLVHSRRTVYEIAALIRDIFRPQDNCRNSEQISLEEISTPRRQPKIFSTLYDESP